MDAPSLIQLTFLNHTSPPLGPVTELNGVALLDLSPLLETADQLITQPVAVIYPLHRPLVVSGLYGTKSKSDSAHNRMTLQMYFLLAPHFCNVIINRRIGVMSISLAMQKQTLKMRQSFGGRQH